jgi:hypothetical protein
MVDLGGSLAVASRGLFATGVSTDLNVTYLSSGGKIGDLIRAEASCDKCEFLLPCPHLCFTYAPLDALLTSRSWEDHGIYVYPIQERKRRRLCKGKPHKIYRTGVERSEQHHTRIVAQDRKERVDYQYGEPSVTRIRVKMKPLSIRVLLCYIRAAKPCRDTPVSARPLLAAIYRTPPFVI